MSETLMLLVVAVIILLACRFRDRPSLGRALALGAMCGVLALTHGEQVLVIPVLLVPLILLAGGVSLRHRFVWTTFAVAVTIAVIAPWVAYNSARFHQPVLFGTQRSSVYGCSGGGACACCRCSPSR